MNKKPAGGNTIMEPFLLISKKHILGEIIGHVTLYDYAGITFYEEIISLITGGALFYSEVIPACYLLSKTTNKIYLIEDIAFNAKITEYYFTVLKTKEKLGNIFDYVDKNELLINSL